MPKWIHDRADHIRRKNPSMPKSESFAIATQQAHATGHTPKHYGTEEGKRAAKRKYDSPSQYMDTADPSSKSKSAGLDMAFLAGFSDELTKIATGPTGTGDVMSLAKPKMGTMPKPGAYSTPRISPPATPTSDPLSSTKNIK